MAFTKIYLTNNTAPYTPATLRGAWDDTAGAVTRALEPGKSIGGTSTTVARAETSATNNFDVLLYRGVSGPLASQTLSGTVQVTIGVTESNASGNFAYHVHMYVTTGDSDTPRGTILTDYVETTANEWGTTAGTSGRSFTSAQSLSSLAITSGDRLVVEIGYVAINTSTTSFTGTLGYGTLAANRVVLADTAAGGTMTSAPFLTFSNSITEGVTTDRVSQSVTELVAGQVSAPVRVSQFVSESVMGQASAPIRTSQFVIEVVSGGTYNPPERTEIFIV